MIKPIFEEVFWLHFTVGIINWNVYGIDNWKPNILLAYEYEKKLGIHSQLVYYYKYFILNEHITYRIYKKWNNIYWLHKGVSFISQTIWNCIFFYFHILLLKIKMAKRKITNHIFFIFVFQQEILKKTFFKSWDQDNQKRHLFLTAILKCFVSSPNLLIQFSRKTKSMDGKI